jgi:hypothetical protein
VKVWDKDAGRELPTVAVNVKLQLPVAVALRAHVAVTMVLPKPSMLVLPAVAPEQPAKTAGAETEENVWPRLTVNTTSWAVAFDAPV